MEHLRPSMVWEQFLESTPPNTALLIPKLAKSKVVGSETFWQIDCPRLQLYCEVDGGDRGFDYQTTSAANYGTRIGTGRRPPGFE